MRIETYAQVQQLYQTSQKAPAKTQGTAKTGFRDQLQLSSMAKDTQTAKAAVAQAPDIRTDVVAKIKEQVQSGTYNVDVNSFADKLFAKFEDQR